MNTDMLSHELNTQDNNPSEDSGFATEQTQRQEPGKGRVEEAVSLGINPIKVQNLPMVNSAANTGPSSVQGSLGDSPLTIRPIEVIMEGKGNPHKSNYWKGLNESLAFAA